MEPLIALVGVTLVLLVAGAAGVRRLRPWPVAVRGGLAAMFVLTGGAHFVGMRADLINMVPPALPAPGLLVTVSGVLELAGAAGLLWSPTVPWAAGGLSLMLIALFPANVHAAAAELTVGGAPAEALLPRTLMQLLFLAAILAVLVEDVRRRRRTRRSTDAATRAQLLQH